MLYLRDSLTGDALKTIDGLGCSKQAYEAAKMRLEKKYGGSRRERDIKLDEVFRFEKVRDGSARDMEHFGEMISNLVVHHLETGLQAELGSGLLYSILKKKLPEKTIARYKRWVSHQRREENVYALQEFVEEEAELLIEASEIVRGFGADRERKNTQARSLAAPASSDSRRTHYMKCRVCNNNHGIWACSKFKAMKIDQKWQAVKDAKACFQCLSTFHRRDDCKRGKPCGENGCPGKHHPLLHDNRPRRGGSYGSQDGVATDDADTAKQTSDNKFGVDAAPKRQTSDAGATSMAVASNVGVCEGVSLRTIPVVVRHGDVKVQINALLDDGGGRSFIDQDLAGLMGLSGKPVNLTLSVMTGKCSKVASQAVDLSVESVDGLFKTPVTALTVPRVLGNMHPVDWTVVKDRWEHLKDIPFPVLTARHRVELVIGSDMSGLHRSFRDVPGNACEPMARLTPLGWTCTGPSSPDDINQSSAYSYFLQTDEAVEVMMKKFWEIEDPPTVITVNPDEQEAMKIVSEGMYKTDERYCVPLPWKPNKSELADNKEQALKRLYTTERKLGRDSELAAAYQQVIKDYLRKGYIRHITEKKDIAKTRHFLPHFPVLRPDKPTTKTRPVFDASAKCHGLALNHTLHSGPKLQNNLLTVLLRFRRYEVALVSDVKEMYLQIEMLPEDSLYHRFFWRDMKLFETPHVYEFTRVVFGVNSSPFIAQYASRHNATEHSSTHPIASETVLESTYMDDSMDSVETEVLGLNLYKELLDLWGKAGMSARKWLSNSKTVLAAVPKEDRAESLDLVTEEMPDSKTLGVMWRSSSDCFSFSAREFEKSQAVTKRMVLSRVATLFDPLGLVAPATIIGRMFIQKIWTEGYDWDTVVRSDLVRQIDEWCESLRNLTTIEVPRILLPTDRMSCDLHVFADSSEEAYGAVGYIRSTLPSGDIIIRLAMAKAKVCPIQTISMPRLELMAAVLGLRLAEVVGPAVGIDRQNWTFWSDNMDTLFWIRGRSRAFKPFVANRVGVIQSGSSPRQWRYVPTHTNPADLVSRGMKVRELLDCELWWKGPDFLQLPPEDWPVNDRLNYIPDNTELKASSVEAQSMLITDSRRRGPVNLRGLGLVPARFSNLRRMAKVLGYVLRFTALARKERLQDGNRPISPCEFEDAVCEAIRSDQFEHFSGELKILMSGRSVPPSSKLAALRPWLDENGVIRSNTRLSKGEYLPWTTRYPILLPRRGEITRLIIDHVHTSKGHPGVNQTLAELSVSYWMPAAREAIRERIAECRVCRRLSTRPLGQVMAPLPTSRLKATYKPFELTSIDYAGPFLTKQGRGRARQKRYLCLFTCMSVRAVHLEFTYSMDTDSFLLALTRMIARRGMIKEIWSDNGSNFVGGERELRELLEKLDQDRLKERTAEQGITWHFQPPGAPHFSGVHESLIKSAKKALAKVLSGADLSDEELQTAMAGAESLINSRPLTYQSADSSDPPPLTPNHFLTGSDGRVRTADVKIGKNIYRRPIVKLCLLETTENDNTD